MKIGLVSSFMPPHLGGLEQIAENLFLGYRRHGVDVRWVSSRIPRTTPPLEDGRTRVPTFNWIEDALGVPVPVWGRRGWQALEELVVWADALHVLECLYLTSAMAMALARRHGKPVVLSQNIGFIRYAFPPLNWIEAVAYRTLGRRVLRSAAHVVAATASAERYVVELLAGRQPPTSAFPVGIDTQRFRPATSDERRRARAELGVAEDRPVVLFAGRLVEKKGLPIVLGVARRLPQVGFLVCGDGPLRVLMAAAPPNVVWHRSILPARMPLCYAVSDCLLLPSHGEGLPLAVQEAMAASVPCVVSEDEPYAEALKTAGVAVGAARAVDAMAGAVERLLGGDHLVLGALGRAHAEAHWSIDTMVSRHTELFGRLGVGAGGFRP